MNISQDKSVNLDANFNFEIFEKIKDEVVIFEINRDILDSVADLRVIYANTALPNDLKESNELIGKTISELYEENIAEQYLKTAAEILSSGKGKKYEVYFETLDKFCSVSAYSPDNEIIITILSDITELKKSSNKSERIIENIDEIYFELDNEWRFINYNSKIKSFIGEKELTGKIIWDEFKELKDSEVYNKLHEAKSKNINALFNIKSPKNEEWYKFQVYTHPYSMEVYSQNINQKIMAEKELKETQIKFKTLFEENNDAIILSDIETGKYVNINRKAEELTGYTKEELLSMGTDEISSNDLKEMAINELRQLSKEGNIKIETEIQTKKRGIVPIEVSTSIIETPDKIYSFNILRDINRVKEIENEKNQLHEEMKVYIKELEVSNEKLESVSKEIGLNDEKLQKKEDELLSLKKELQESEAHYKILAENLPSILMRYDNNLRVVYLAPSAEHITDVAVDDFIGKTNREVGMPEELSNIWDSGIKKVFQTGNTHELDFEFSATNNNHPKSFHLKLIPEFDSDGETVRHVLGISTDISRVKESKLENQELRKRVQQFAEELETSMDEIEAANEELRIANRKISKGKDNLAEIKKALQENEKESLQLLVEIDTIYNYAPIGLCTLDRELKYIRVNKKLAEINGLSADDHIGKTINEISPDIAEQAKDIAQFIFKNGLPVLDFEFSRTYSDGTLRSWNKQWVPLKDIDGNIVGINVSVIETSETKNIEMQLKKAEDIAENKLKEQKEEFEGTFDNLLKLFSTNERILESTDDLIAAWNTEYEFISFNNAYKDISKKLLGKEVELGMSIKDLLLDSQENHFEVLQLWEKALKGEKFSVEMVFEIDSQNMFYEITFYPLKNEQGNLIGTTHIARNITEHQKLEEKLKKQVEDLKISNEELKKFPNVGSLDLDESFEDIESFIQLLENQYKDKSDEDVGEFISDLMGASIPWELDNFNESFPLLNKVEKFNSIYTNSMIDHVINTFKESIGEHNGEITYDTLPNVKGDAGQLQNVFQNLISNSIKFRNPDKPLKIHISAKEDKQNNEYIFKVMDNGMGLERLDADTEIELTNIAVVIQRHGGRVWFESIPNVGSIFYFTLPINHV